MTFRLFLGFALLSLLLVRNPLQAQESPASLWADSVLKTLTLREKIGQLVMMPVYSNRDADYYKVTADTIALYQPGILIFFQGSPQKQTLLLNEWQKLTKIPMLTSMDAEWGPAMRLDSVIAFPRLMALAATADTNLIYQYGKAIGSQCHRLGLHIDYAPVVDVNNNPLNPVINYRSFGENQHKVALYASVFCRGMMSEGVLPVAKHFPGHGNTSQDSHKTLPDITDNAAVVDSVHLYPFRKMIEENIWGIMVAHVFIPVLDPTKNLPSSLSPSIINGLLRNKYGYQGLILTDALGMKGVTGKNKPGSIGVKALLAGNDILTMPENIGLTIDSIAAAVKQGRLTEARIDTSVRKVLMAKYNENLTRWLPIETKNITADLNKPEYKQLKQRIYEQAVTLVFDKKSCVPLISDKKKIAVVSFRADTLSAFHREAAKYAVFDTYFIPDTLNDSTATKLIKKAMEYDQVICAVHAMSFLTKQNYGFYPRTIAAVDSLCRKTSVVLCLFGNPYAYREWKSSVSPDALLVTYERDPLAELACAKILFGVLPAQGKLPVSINAEFREGQGMTSTLTNRLTEVDPAALNMNTLKLDSIGLMVEKAILDSVFPGCQILAAQNGKIFYNKSFGYHTYDKSRPVRFSDLYDLASVTKALSTTLAMMRLYEQGQVALESELQQYFPMAKNTPCATLHIDRLLTHSAGLPPWLPLYTATLKNGYPDSVYYKTTRDSVFCLQLSDSLFMRYDYPDSMLMRILSSKININQGYKYSDLGFILLKEVVEHVSGETIDVYMEKNFYRPLGLTWMTYNPTTKFPLSVIPPTEDDKSFRHRPVHGYVHDQAAAMFGGVSGHAGLFGNAYDAAVMLQMLIQKGNYAGVQYFKASTVQRFTSTYFDKNRRGLGFDKPSGTKNGNVCEEASARSFGHSGFTGTFIWADPVNGLIYVFLSNRVYPDAENWKITEQNIRTRIHSLLYQAVDTP